MKVVFISDTHSLHRNIIIPPADLLIHAGDCMNSGTRIDELVSFREWISQAPCSRKIVVPGNHDVLFQKDLGLVKTVLGDVIEVKLDESETIDGHKFYFSPWSPRFGLWGFGATTLRLRELWNQIPGDTEILVTHGPPFQVLDRNRDGQNCGCLELRNRIVNLPLLKYHVFGHIHEGYGTAFKFNVWFVNASICTWNYIPSNHPKVVEI